LSPIFYGLSTIYNLIKGSLTKFEVHFNLVLNKKIGEIISIVDDTAMNQKKIGSDSQRCIQRMRAKLEPNKQK